jgi:hypothetical protein
MPLFSRIATIPRPVTVKYIPVPVVPDYLPAQYRDLPCACPRHGVPVPMRFAGFTKSDKGFTVARYTCPMSGCGHQEFYGRDYNTGKPRLIFARG